MVPPAQICEPVQASCRHTYCLPEGTLMHSLMLGLKMSSDRCHVCTLIELENTTALAWPIVVIHEDMFDGNSARIHAICTSFRDFGSRLIFVTDTLTAHSKRLVLQYGFQDCIEWSAHNPLPFVQCCQHAIEQAAMVRQIADQDVLFSGIECGAMDGLGIGHSSHRGTDPRFKVTRPLWRCADYRPETGFVCYIPMMSVPFVPHYVPISPVRNISFNEMFAFVYPTKNTAGFGSPAPWPLMNWDSLNEWLVL